MWERQRKNKHGVEVIEYTTGHYGHYDKDGKWRDNNPIMIPLCCTQCFNFDPGEVGDYGERLTPPWCLKNVFFPTKKGTCKLQNKR